MIVLCVGGPWDGKMIAIPKSHNWFEIAVPRDNAIDFAFDKVTYTCHSFKDMDDKIVKIALPPNEKVSPSKAHCRI